MSKFKKIYNEDGYALVFTFLLIITVVSLITVLLNISLTEFKQAERNKNNVKAYYLARSGAEIMAEYIIENEDQAIANIELDKEKSLLDESQGKVISNVTVNEVNTDNYDIVSTATVNNINKTVTVNISKNIPGLFDAAIFAKNDLDLTKMDYVEITDADLETNSSSISYNEDDVYFSNVDLVTNSKKEFQSVNWTNKSIQNLVNQDPTGKVIENDTISESGYYKDVSYNNSALTIEYPVGVDEINIAADTFSLKSDLVFTNADGSTDNIESKHLNLYIKESITFQTPNVTIPNLNIFLMANSSITLIANSDLPENDGIFVYGPESDMIMQSNKTEFSGSVIVNSFEGQGNLAMGSYVYESFTEEEQAYIENIVKSNIKYKINKWDR